MCVRVGGWVVVVVGPAVSSQWGGHTVRDPIGGRLSPSSALPRYWAEESLESSSDIAQSTDSKSRVSLLSRAKDSLPTPSLKLSTIASSWCGVQPVVGHGAGFGMTASPGRPVMMGVNGPIRALTPSPLGPLRPGRDASHRRSAHAS